MTSGTGSLAREKETCPVVSIMERERERRGALPVGRAKLGHAKNWATRGDPRAEGGDRAAGTGTDRAA